MPDDFRQRVPAAFPCLAFVLGLVSATGLIAPRLSATGLIATGFLLVFLSAGQRDQARKSITRVAIVILFLASGILIGNFHAASLQSSTVLDSTAPPRFSLIRAPLHRGWSTDPSGRATLRSPWFDLQTAGHFVRINEPVIIVAPAVPEGVSSHVEAEGFLDRSESGGLVLHCKSALLLHPWGRESLLDPLTWNRHLSALINGSVVDTPSARGAALAGALLLGRSSELPQDIIEGYQHGGTYHLLVFSGLQLALLAGLIASTLVWIERPVVTDILLVLFALFITRFIGNDPSVSRSAAMLALLSASRILRRPTPIENLYFLSAMLRLAFVPDDLARPGFLLTYGATGGLILIARPLVTEWRVRSRVLQTAIYAATAELTTIPLTIQFFHRFAIGSSLVSIVLMPLLVGMCALSVGVAAAALGNARDLAAALLMGIDRLNDLALAGNGALASTHLTGVAGPATLAVLITSYVAAGIVMASAPRHIARLAPFLFLLPIASVVVNSARLRTVALPQLEVLDVGQGDSILLRSGSSVLLVDGGGHPGNARFGDRVLVPKLLARGVRHVSAVVLSHPHPDHCGGLPAVLEELTVDELWIARRHLHSECARAMFAAIGTRPVNIRFIDTMHSADIGEIKLNFFTTAVRFKRAVENNSSSVVEAKIGRRSILLTGDIEREAEGRLLGEAADQLGVDVLKVAHHGSRTSSTESFLAAAHPRIAIISCGRRNFFGHPHAEVLARLRQIHVRVFRTDQNGDVCIAFRQNHLFITTEIDSVP